MYTNECYTCGMSFDTRDPKKTVCHSCEQAPRTRDRGGAYTNPHVTKRSDIDKIILTTETVTNLNVTKRIEIVTAEVAYGINIFKDLFAGVRDIVGGRSAAVQKTMRDARRTALYELKKEAHEVGANAVVGVDLDYVELSGMAGNMVMLVASGTAVIVNEQTDTQLI